MKIAFMHYHLKPGGVTTVLKQQVQALPEDWQSLAIAGFIPEAPFPAEVVQIPQLDYSDNYQKTFDPVAAAKAILGAIQSRFNGPCDVLHVHNATLAKNRYFLKILAALQDRGVKLLLQIHDFAEDGRPRTYFDDAYPADCHYGVINSRDRDILLKAGLKPDGLHLMTNMVDDPGFSPTTPGQNSLVLYPIRAIRRKNLGEAILLSLFFSSGKTLGITLPPNSPIDFKSYRGWKVFVQKQGLSVVFDLGLKNDFKALVASADFLITTSISEGFGFSFVEPWLFEKLLWGRRLPEICRDFESRGIDLAHLYNGLAVPIDWIGRHQFYQRWQQCVLNAGAFLRFPIDRAHMQAAFSAMTQNAVIDFGLLDEFFQKRVILDLLSDRQHRQKLIRLNPWLAAPGRVPDKLSLIKQNRRAVLKGYNQSVYRRRLINIYQKVSWNDIRQSIDKKVLLAEFLNLRRFSLLKWGDYLE